MVGKEGSIRGKRVKLIRQRFLSIMMAVALLSNVFLILSNYTAGSAGADTQAVIKVVSGRAFSSHQPILISGNSEFTSANGVTCGSGTETDPFIIEGWEINASTTHGIEVEYTDAYFIIRNCKVYGNNAYHGIYLDNIVNGVIDNITSYNNYDGIYLAASSDNQITNCDVYNNSYEGIYLYYYSNNNTISNCYAYNNTWYGIRLDSSSNNNQITNSAVYNNPYYGIFLYSSNNNTITNCNIYNNSYGIVQSFSSNNSIENCAVYDNNNIGVWFWSGLHTSLKYLRLYDNPYGLKMSYFSNYNQITYCNLSSNTEYGIYLDPDNAECDYNILHHNNFFNNVVQAYDPFMNYWNTSDEGNYWDDYTGVDDDEDSIGDTPYNISGDSNQDMFPLMEPLNWPPVASFIYTPASPVTQDLIQFTDTSTDYDGTIVSRYWEFGDETTSTEQNTTHQYTQKGTYYVSLTVTDDDGESDTISKVVTVGNTPPVANFTYLPANPTTSDNISFTDSSTDFDGSVVSWSWDFGDDSTSSLQNPAHQYADDGAYTVTLTVVDNDGGTDTISKNISVGNTLPIANFTYSPINPSDVEIINFTDISLDSDGYVVSWVWDFGDGTNSTVQNPSHQYANNGIYTVTLTVTDDDGDNNSISKDINVLTVSPTANFTYTPVAPSTSDLVDFTDTSLDIDGSIVSWLWDFGDGNSSTLQNTTHSYADDGTYTVTLTVWDDDSAVANVSKQVVVSNVGPTANFTYTPSSLSTADTIQFSDNSTDTDGSVVFWYWEFGDGVQSLSQNPTHQYIAPGTYTVTLTVTDDDSSAHTVSINITIANQPPTIILSSLSDNEKVKGLVTISGIAQDLDGTVEKVELRIDNSGWLPVIGTTMWYYLWDTAGVSDGMHTVSVRAWDGSENSTIETITIKVINTEDSSSFQFDTIIVIIAGVVLALTAGAVIGILLFRWRKGKPLSPIAHKYINWKKRRSKKNKRW